MSEWNDWMKERSLHPASSPPRFPIRQATREDTLAAELERNQRDELKAALATDEEIAATFNDGIHLNEHEAQTVLAALRAYQEDRPGVYSAALKIEAWLLAR